MTNNSFESTEPVNQIPDTEKSGPAASQQPAPADRGIPDSDMPQSTAFNGPSRPRMEPPYCRTLRSQFPLLWKVCLIYGICYVLFAYRNLDGIGSGIFAGISACVLLAVAKWLKDHPSEGETFSITFRADSIFYFVAAVLLSFGNCLTDSSFFLFFNHIGSFLLFSIACMKLFYNDKAWDFGQYTFLLFAFWMQTLEMVPVPFRDFGYYRKGTKKKLSATKRYVLIGIVLGLPILLVTTLLLASADQIFSDMLGKIFNFEIINDWLMKNLPENIVLLPCGFILYTLLIYLVFAALCRGELVAQERKPRMFGTAIAVTVFCMIDVVYVLFSGIQFLYLFAGGLPDGYVYAEYARRGFFELLFVALINFILVLSGNRYFVKNTALKISMTVTCFCTYVMILSSAYRMYMYIDVYHLTFLRVFVLWFLLLLTFFMAGSTISIYRENWNSFRYCLLILTVFYLVFSLSGVHGRIARYNVAQFEHDMQENRGGRVPVLEDYLPDGYMDSKSYAVALSSLKAAYGAELGKDNLEVISDYLQVSQHFYEYYWTEESREESEEYYDDYREDDDNVQDHYRDEFGEERYELKKSAAIYDKKIPNSIFMWKHFNFVENACYQRCKATEGQK